MNVIGANLLEFDCRLRYPSGFQLNAAFATKEAATGLVGPSGSGKTTILSLIAGLRKPDAGQIRLGNRVLYDSSSGASLAANFRRIGYVFQDDLLFPHLNVRDNLLYGFRRRSTTEANDRPAASSKPAAALKRVRRWLTPAANAGTRIGEFDRVTRVLELTELLDRLPHTLSGGQRQRVAIGRALLSAPELLLLDEPLASVHAELKEQVLAFLEAILNEWRIPTLYVTHDLHELQRIGQWVVTLDNGRVLSQGPHRLIQ
jgi:molybdate transport system ATP-binding protein